jgi:hypothetical protein
MSEQEKERLLNLFNENRSEIDWERVDRVDDYAWDCCGYVEIDGYEFEVSATESCDEYEIYSVTVTTPNGESVDIW